MRPTQRSTKRGRATKSNNKSSPLLVTRIRHPVVTSSTKAPRQLERRAHAEVSEVLSQPRARAVPSLSAPGGEKARIRIEPAHRVEAVHEFLGFDQVHVQAAQPAIEAA